MPSEDKFRGREISYCAVCYGPLFKNRNLLIVGGGNCAAIDAIYLSNLVSSVKLVHRRSTLRAEKVLIKSMENKV
ncbi:NAD-binding protein [Thermoproteota archaeon]